MGRVTRLGKFCEWASNVLSGRKESCKGILRQRLSCLLMSFGRKSVSSLTVRCIYVEFAERTHLSRWSRQLFLVVISAQSRLDHTSAVCSALGHTWLAEGSRYAPGWETNLFDVVPEQQPWSLHPLNFREVVSMVYCAPHYQAALG
jgi:hypothetical protein